MASIGERIDFPTERMLDRAIVAALLPYIEQAALALEDATADALADAAYRLLDPKGISPPLIRDGCRATLLQIARDWLGANAR